MRTLILTVLLLPCAFASAQVYKCPPFYPGKDAGTKNLPVTNASVYWGELHGDGALKGDDKPVQDGIDVHYGLANDEQGWLVCAYGGRKRIKGKVHDGHEWGQYMVSGNREWWMKLAPKVSLCTVQVREAKSRDQGKSTWTITAVCKQPEP
jgi:hypothetical protein